MQKIPSLHTNGWFTNYQCIGLHIQWWFTSNDLDRFKTNTCDSSNNPSGCLKVHNVWVYTPSGSPKTIKYRVYSQIGGSPTINDIIYALFGAEPKLKV